MLTELTLLTTFAIHHLLLGGCMIVILFTLIKILKLSAEMQSWLWLTAFIISTLVPFSLFVQEVEPSPLVENVMYQQTSISNSAPGAPQTLITNNQPQSGLQWHVPSNYVYQATSGLYLFLFIWSLGTCWRGISVCGSIINTRKLIKSAQKINMKYRFEHIGNIEVLQSTLATTPMVTGFFRPFILLPTSLLVKFDNKQLTPIILHEFAHIQRKDLWIGVFQEAIAIVFWWSPVIRLLNRKIHINRELACDLRAAKKLANRKQYAQSLLDCTKLMLSEHKNLLAMGLFSKKKDLTYRVANVLKTEKLKKPNASIIAISCLFLGITTASTAQSYAPHISLSSIQKEVMHFSLLTRSKGEMLMEAIDDSDLNLIQLMIDNGLDINTPIIGDGNALIVAVKYDKKDVVESLIAWGADVNQAAEGDGNPLIAAAMNKNLPMAKLLYQNGADVNAIVKSDETPLINASRQNDFNMVEFLVENGADVNLGLKVLNVRDGKNIVEYRSPLNMTKSSKIRHYLLSQGAQM
ncbi:MAG: bla regulator protein BlaR1 [Flavobacteriales bacterium]|jgi:bla regulator protein BlaR1